MRHYVLLTFAVLAGIVPFSSRAVYLDEHIFLQIARSAKTNLLFPQETPGIFFGTPIRDFAAHTHPPVGEYYLALLYSLVGEFREVPFRLLFSIFAIAAVLSFYTLAKRFTAHPLFVALLFAVSPAFFVYSPTLMMDIPMLAFLLIGLVLYFGHLQGRRCLLPFAALCFILAVGIGYTALVPLGCFFLGLLAAKRPLKELLTVAAAPIALLLWLAGMTVHFGEFPLLATVRYVESQGSIFRNSLAILSFIGSVGTFPWLLNGKRLPITTSVVAVALLTLFTSWPSLGYRLWFIALASSGVIVLITFAAAARTLIASAQNSGETLLILWVPATLLFFILCSDMINARYILLAIPPLFLVIFRQTSKRRLISSLIPTAVLSLILAYADFKSVNANREWVERNIGALQQQGFRVWGGAETGLRFYLEQKGVATLTSKDARPAPGDLVVRHASFFRYSLSERVETVLTVLKTFTLDDAFPVRIYNSSARTGFHDSSAGLVPFTISYAPVDRIEVAQISPLPDAAWSPDGVIFMQNEPEREFTLRMPANSKIEYEVDGDGLVVVTDGQIRLIKGPSPKIVWRNFRIVPKQFAVQ